MKTLYNIALDSTWRLSRLWTSLMLVNAVMYSATLYLVADHVEVWRYAVNMTFAALYMIDVAMLGWKANEDLA